MRQVLVVLYLDIMDCPLRHVRIGMTILNITKTSAGQQKLVTKDPSVLDIQNIEIRSILLELVG